MVFRNRSGQVNIGGICSYTLSIANATTKLAMLLFQPGPAYKPDVAIAIHSHRLILRNCLSSVGATANQLHHQEMPTGRGTKLIPTVLFLAQTPS